MPSSSIRSHTADSGSLAPALLCAAPSQLATLSLLIREPGGVSVYLDLPQFLSTLVSSFQSISVALVEFVLKYFSLSHVLVTGIFFLNFNFGLFAASAWKCN